MSINPLFENVDVSTPSEDDPDDVINSIKGRSLTPVEEFAANIGSSMKRGLPKFFGHIVKPGFFPWNPGPVAIIAGGPTLKYTLDKAREFKTKIVCGTAHDHVVSQGIVADYCVIYDPDPESMDWIKNLQRYTIYLVCSHCPPRAFDELAGYNVVLWHAQTHVPLEIFGSHPSIGGGSTAVLRATHLAVFLGFWDQHFFGLDSCYLDDDNTHAYDTFNWVLPQRVWATNEDNGRRFKTSTGLLVQAREFREIFRRKKNMMRATLYGDNLIAEMVREDEGREGIVLG
jgi:hypothetical protein